MRRNIAVVLVLLLAGCSVGPKYQRPEIPAPQNHRGLEGPAAPETLADVPWWKVFDDEALQGLIREAIANNNDLKLAAARVEEARARAGIAKSFLYPEVNGTFGFTSDRGSLKSDPPQGTADNNKFENWNLGFSLSWELDFFGRLRSQKAAAVAQFLASEEARTSVLITLVGDVAQSYFTLRELDLELEISKRTLDVNDQTLKFYQDRRQGGVSNMLEVQQAIANRARTAAAIPEIERLITIQEDLISVLLGRNPGPIPRGKLLQDTSFPPAIPTGLPSQLLERRPDIRAAEENLIAANANIGAAKALFYPNINLSALGGWNSKDFGDLFSSDAGVWSIGLGLLQPIFNGGRIKQNYEASKAQYEQAVVFYRQTILSSFREVADALVSLQKFKEVIVQQQAEVDARREIAKLTRARYDTGLSSYLEVLLNDLDLFNAEIVLARTKGQQINAYVQLYRALGGGWQQETTNPETVQH